MRCLFRGLLHIEIFLFITTNMRKKNILDIINAWKIRKGVSIYTPFKYFKGLTTKRDIEKRAREIMLGTKTNKDDPKAYSKKAFLTDSKSSTKPSSYTKDFQRKHPNAKSLKEKSISTGVPHHIIKKVYDKGVAAWRTGHRVGATPEQWGHARVHSFLTLGCTAMSSDSKLLKLATSRMAPKHRKALLAQNIKCPETKLKTKYYSKLNMPRWLKSQTI